MACAKKRKHSNKSVDMRHGPDEHKHETLGWTSTRTGTRTRTSVFAKFHRRAHIRRPKAIRTDVDNHGGRIDIF